MPEMYAAIEAYRISAAKPFDAFVPPTYHEKAPKLAPGRTFVICPNDPSTCGFSQDYITAILCMACVTGVIKLYGKQDFNVVFASRNSFPGQLEALLDSGAVLLYDGTGEFDDVAEFTSEAFQRSEERDRLLYIGESTEHLVNLAMLDTGYNAAMKQLRKAVWGFVFDENSHPVLSQSLPAVELVRGILSPDELSLVNALEELNSKRACQLSKFLRYRVLDDDVLKSSSRFNEVEQLTCSIRFLERCWITMKTRKPQPDFDVKHSFIYDMACELGIPAMIDLRKSGLPEEDILA